MLILLILLKICEFAEHICNGNMLKNIIIFLHNIIRLGSALIYILLATFILWLIYPLSFLDPSILDEGQQVWAKILLWILNIKVNVKVSDDYTNCAHKNEPCILTPNHTSVLDILVLLSVVKGCKFIMKKELLYYIPYISLLAVLYQHIPINRKNRKFAIQSLNKGAENVIKNNNKLIIFPEGTRCKDGSLKRFKKGAFYISKDFNIPIVPVIIDNTDIIWNKSSWYPFEGTVVIYILNKIDNTNIYEVNKLLKETRKSMKKLKNKIDDDKNNKITNKYTLNRHPASIYLNIFYVTAGYLIFTTLYYFLLKYTGCHIPF